MKRNILPLAVFAVIIASCESGTGGNANVSTDTGIAPTVPVTNNPVTGPDSTGANPVIPNTVAPVTTSSAGLNPAHGEPGHRCDIPVGQPLNSAPSPTNPSITTTATQPVVQPTAPAISTTPINTGNSTAAGINPAHGQPGHRCDIPVGQPLNSKPAGSPTIKVN